MAKKPLLPTDPHGTTPATGSDRHLAERTQTAPSQDNKAPSNKAPSQDNKDGFIYKSADGRVTQKGTTNPNTGKLEFPSITLGPRPKPGSPESLLPSQSKPKGPKNLQKR